MTNHDDEDDNRDNDRNKEKNSNDNVASRSGYDGLIFDPITTPWSQLGFTVEDWATKMTELQPQHHMYLHVGVYLPYKHPKNDIVNMCHKLRNAKFGVLDVCY